MSIFWHGLEGMINNRLHISLKSVIFAMGWKGQMRADLEQAKTHKHQHQINTNLKNTNNMFYSVRGETSGVCTE